ncbi:Alginate export [Sphingomonas gellani]|uniref:Alginate export n=1 Tax=Sphingomonas gellani TaxID=1166340 RepID=A0A1H8CXT9_9SPHN|nr:alginate export family protein [Sphingomonas gellani]SEM98997.1 Alginate export [Sphingomonas gellani]
MSINPRGFATATAALALVAAASAPAQTNAPSPPATAQNERARQTLAAPLSESYPVEALGNGSTANGYNQSRWVEDWSALSDPAKRRDPIDRMKFIPLVGDDVYLTLSGEVRLRVNQTTNPDLREQDAQRQDIDRIVGGADLHVGKHFRFFGEVAHAGISGPNIGSPSGLLRNRLIVQQSFADATTQVGGADLGIRYGRQTFADGPNLLVVPRDNNTIFLTFNGVRAWGHTRTTRVDVFDFTVTRPGQTGTGDDLNSDGRRFSGVSGGVVLPRDLFGGSKLYVDPFFWRLRNRAAVWGGQSAREEREFYGLHIWGDAGPVNLDWTINHQGGRYADRDISAWQLLFAQSYRVGKDRSAPRVGFHVDYASGGGAYDGGKLRNALAPFGNNVYYSYQLYATPTNLIAAAPNVSFQPMAKVRASLEYQFSWRDSLSDAVYRANGQAFAGTQSVAGRKVAETARAQVVWSLSPRLSVTGRYEHLAAGPALTNAGYRSSDFLAGWISLRF